MDVDALKIFVEVVRLGSFAAVAREKDIDPSSVSRTIANLEDELGVRLFQRSTRHLSLTEAGGIYFQRIEPVVDEIDQANVAASDVSSSPRGVLRVTASVSFGHERVVPLLPAFTQTYPDLTIDLSLTDTVLDLLSERIDVAIRLGPPADSSLIAIPLVRTQYVVCASPRYLQEAGALDAPAEVSRRSCLLFPLSGFRSRWLFRDRQGEVLEVPVSGRVLISSAISLRECARAGMGVALLSRWLVEDDLASGALVDLFPNYDVTATDFNTAAWIVYPSRAYVPLKVRSFIEFLKQHVSD